MWCHLTDLKSKMKSVNRFPLRPALGWPDLPQLMTKPILQAYLLDSRDVVKPRSNYISRYNPSKRGWTTSVDRTNLNLAIFGPPAFPHGLTHPTGVKRLTPALSAILLDTILVVCNQRTLLKQAVILPVHTRYPVFKSSHCNTWLLVTTPSNISHGPVR